MRVLSPDEEGAYLKSATALGGRLERDYANALGGIRATVRGEQPIKPDAYLLLHVATVLLECGLRPEECYRLNWDQIQDGAITIHHGKGRGSRRRVPCTPRVMAVLEMRRSGSASQWVFPCATKSGHMEGTTLKKQHAAAIKAAQVPPFVIYDFRHTRITRWAKVLLLPVVQRLAGHTDISTTMRYVHLSDADVRAAMAKEQEDRSRHTSGHTSAEINSPDSPKFIPNG
jgi:integrase